MPAARPRSARSAVPGRRRTGGPASCMVAAMRGLPLLLALLLLPAAATAAELQFSAAVDRTTVGLGEQFQLDLTVQGEDMASVPRPSLPALPDFAILGSSSSQSTNISFINGQMKKQASVDFVYALAARKLGRLVIPPCRLTYQGREYTTQPVEITVVKAAQGAAQPATPAPPGARGRGGDVSLDGNLFLLATPSRRTVYVGEPVLLDIALYSRVRLTNGGWANVPSFDGFWAEKIYDADRFDFHRANYQGKAFDVARLKTVALSPISPGNVTVKPMAFNAVVLRSSNDFFDMFGAPQNVRLESKPVTIQVLPLPEAGRPPEFTGGVGRFAMTAALDRNSTSGSEPVNLMVRIGGSGNVRLIEKPVLPAVPGLRILDPEVKDEVRATADGVRGTKTFRYPILPQADGKYVIAPIRVACFDPQARAYRTLSAGPFEFSATGSTRNAPLVEATGLRVLGTDIRYIKADAPALAVAPLAAPWWPNLLYLLGLGIVGGALGYRRHEQRLHSDRGYARKVRSSRLVRARLRQAETLLKRRDEKGFHAALAQAVMGYVGDRHNLDPQAMTRDQLRAELEQRQVAPEAAAAVMEVLTQCDFARFSPGLMTVRDPRELFEKARNALGRV
jgi:hypothetical protein